jgi:hypothetical protein
MITELVLLGGLFARTKVKLRHSLVESAMMRRYADLDRHYFLDGDPESKNLTSREYVQLKLLFSSQLETFSAAFDALVARFNTMDGRTFRRTFSDRESTFEFFNDFFREALSKSMERAELLGVDETMIKYYNVWAEPGLVSLRIMMEEISAQSFLRPHEKIITILSHVKAMFLSMVLNTRNFDKDFLQRVLDREHRNWLLRQYALCDHCRPGPLRTPGKCECEKKEEKAGGSDAGGK